MKKGIISLGSLICLCGLLGCSNSVENNQFSVVCRDVEECRFDYVKHGEIVDYMLDCNEILYFNYPDEGRIKIRSSNYTVKIYSTEEIVTNNDESVLISENNISLLD